LTRTQRYPINSFAAWLHAGLTNPFVFILLLVILLLGGWYGWYGFNEAIWDGRLELSALEKPVRVYRDQHGIPYIHAQSQSDALKTQGFITAQDRWVQMELYRRIILGRAAEFLGQEALSQDIEMRVANLKGLANDHWRRLQPDTRQFLEDYTTGINAYIQGHTDDHPVELGWMGLKPERWESSDILAYIYFVSWSHSVNYDTEWLTQKILNVMGVEQITHWLPVNRNLDRKQVAQQIQLSEDSRVLVSRDASKTLNVTETNEMGSDKADPDDAKLDTDVPVSDVAKLKFGSNNWAIHSERSASGKPMLANDPHLDMRLLPGIWYPIVIHMPNQYWAGFSMAGIPGIFFGRNQSLAFGLTNAYGDVQDLFYIPVGDDDKWVKNTREEIIKVKTEQGLIEERIQVRETEMGPIISDHFERFRKIEESIVLGWSPSFSKQQGIGLDRLVNAANVQQAQQAIAEMDVMQFNWVLADKDNQIAHQASGLIPVRKLGVGAAPVEMDKKTSLWPGWIPKAEMPHQFNPSIGWVGTANQDTREEGYPYYYSSYFAPTYRYSRIKTLMQTKSQWSSEDLWMMMLDKYNPQTALWLPYMLNVLEKKPGYLDWYQRLKHWNGIERSDQVAPSLYKVIYQHTARLLFEEYLPKALVKELMQMPYYWQERLDEWLRNPNQPWPANSKQTVAEHIDLILFQAMVSARESLVQRLGRNIEDWTWGNLHEVVFQSPILNAKPVGWLFERRFPLSGSGETLFRAQPDYDSYDSIFFDSARIVVDIGDDEKMQGVMAGGISSRHFTPWLDNFIQSWSDETSVAIWLQESMQKQHAHYQMELYPQALESIEVVEVDF
jgi:penicillin amidase